jgi:hypothetical protein
VYYVICSYDDEEKLYLKIVSYLQSTTITGNIVFIFLRWSPHFVSFYTTQFLPNTTATSSSYYFSILHLLPTDIGASSSFNDTISNYEDILSSTSNMTFGDDVRILDEKNFVLFF